MTSRRQPKTPERGAAATGDPLPVFVLDMEEQPDTGSIALYGCTSDRRSVMLTVQGFSYYFTVSADGGAITKAGLRRDVLHHIRERLPAAMKGFGMKPVMRRSLVGYQPEVAVPMVQVYPPAGVRNATSRITQAFQAELRDRGVRVYETQIDAVTRFSLDSGIRCGDWLEMVLPGSAVKEEEIEAGGSRTGRATTTTTTTSSSSSSSSSKDRVPQKDSHCDVELVGHWESAAGHVTTCGGVPVQVHAFSKASHWGMLPPLRTLCFSINRYPTSIPARKWADAEDCPDPIRAISVITTIENGSPAHSKRRLVMLNAGGLPQPLEADHYAGPYVTRLYKSETELLVAFQELVLAEDPSLLTGFEVGEALRVLLARAEALKLKGFGEMTRRQGAKVAVKVRSMYSAKWVKAKTRMSGTSNQEGTEVTCSGRVVLDLMRVSQMQDVLRFYSLGEISMTILGKTFETLDTQQTEDLLHAKPTTPTSTSAVDSRVAVARALQAFLSVTDLAIDVLVKRNAVAELVEVSRVTGQPLQDVYIRGQMSRVSSLLQIHCHATGVVIPANTDDLLDKRPLDQAALLLDPSPPSAENPDALGTAGLRRGYTTVLDFTSLYPSIMIEHNLCYSTLVNKDPGAAAGHADVFESPIGARFVGKGAREGVLPRLLADLLEARRQAQSELRQTTGLSEGQRPVLDARQKAFKLASNAVYGYTGASVNALFSRELGDTILSMGREYLTRAIRIVGEEFPALKVIYADTDSIFVEYPLEGGWSREAVWEHSVEVLGPALNRQLPGRIRLKHEKVLGPLLLQHIRRYAALDWGRDGSRRLEMKGLEAVQRNTMPFVVALMESTILKIMDTPPAEAREWRAVKQHVREHVAALMNNKVDIYSLTLTRGLWRLGEYDSKQPHVHLVEKMESAEPRRRFRVGERVAYVLVQREADAPLYRKAEDPFAALQQLLQLDLVEYLKQVRMPMVRLLQLVMPEATAEGLFQVHFRALQVGTKTSSPSAITSFFKASQAAQCLRCRATVPKAAAAGPRRGKGRAGVGGGGGSTGPPLCGKCRAAPDFSLLSLQQAEKEAAAASTRAHAQCGACQRGGHAFPVICCNTTCPVTYVRVKAEREGVETSRRVAELGEALL